MEFIDLKAQYNLLKYEIDDNIRKVLKNGTFIGGAEITDLEERLAQFTGRKYCITCGNGTDALQAAYMAYNITENDAVFCPDLTFISSIEPAYMLGATPIFCDIDEKSYNISCGSLEKQISAVIAEGRLTPKAVVAVDLFGNPCEYEELIQICKRYNMILIEDAAQSFGAIYKNNRCCKFGDIAITSFFPSKPLGCYGDGGAIFTDDDDIARICKSICVHGKSKNGKYDSERIGINSRLDTLQAAILLPKLQALQQYEIIRRQTVAKTYNMALKWSFITPYIPSYSQSVYAQYTILAKNHEERDTVTEHLKENDIPSMIYYPIPQHKLPVFKNLNCYEESYDVTNDFCSRTLSLPMHPYLSEKDQEKIIKCALEAL